MRSKEGVLHFRMRYFITITCSK